MRTIFWGFFMLLIGIDIDLGSVAIRILPEFIGIYVILSGLKQLEHDYPYFSPIKPYFYGLFVYTLISFWLDLSGLGSPAMILILGLGYSIIFFYATFLIITGTQKSELDLDRDLNSVKLMFAFKMMVAATISIYFALIIPALSWAVLIFGFVATILFLYRFRQTMILFETNDLSFGSD